MKCECRSVHKNGYSYKECPHPARWAVFIDGQADIYQRVCRYHVNGWKRRTDATIVLMANCINFGLK